MSTHDMTKQAGVGGWNSSSKQLAITTPEGWLDG